MSLCVFVTPVFVLSGKPGVQDLKGTIAALLPLTSCLPLGVRGLPLDVKGLPQVETVRTESKILQRSSRILKTCQKRNPCAQEIAYNTASSFNLICA